MTHHILPPTPRALPPPRTPPPRHLTDLPTDAVAFVMEALPVCIVRPMTHSRSYEVRTLASRRLWRRVHVSSYSKGSTHDLLFSIAQWRLLVRQCISIPFRIHTLAMEIGGGDLPFLLSPALVAHVVACASSLHLHLHSFDWLPEIEASVPQMALLTNLHTLLVNLSFKTLRRQWWRVPLPPLVREMKITHVYWEDVALRQISIPPSVHRLELCGIFNTPEELPPLPPELQHLVLTNVGFTSFDPFVSMLPLLLRTLTVTRSDGVVVQVNPGMRLPKHLHHNLRDPRVLQTKEAIDSAPPLEQWTVLLDEVDPSRLPQMFPRLRLLRLTYERRLVVDLVLVTNQVLRRVSRLGELHMAGVSTEEVDGLVLPLPLHTVWLPSGLHRIPSALRGHPLLRTLVVMRAHTQQLPEWLAQLPALTEVRIWSCKQLSSSHFGFCAHLKLLTVLECRLREIPAALAWCRRLHLVDLSHNELSLASTNTQVLPSCVRVLRLAGNRGRAVELGVDYATRLLRLEPLRRAVDKWRKLRSPEPESVHAALELPSHLVELDISDCNVSSAWEIPFPPTLRVLDMGYNRQLVSPPPLFRFPSGLEVLRLPLCELGSIDAFCFPRGLVVLDLLFNPMRITAPSLLPPLLQQLCLRRAVDPAELDPLVSYMPTTELVTR